MTVRTLWGSFVCSGTQAFWARLGSPHCTPPGVRSVPDGFTTPDSPDQSGDLPLHCCVTARFTPAGPQVPREPRNMRSSTVTSPYVPLSRPSTSSSREGTGTISARCARKSSATLIGWVM